MPTSDFEKNECGYNFFYCEECAPYVIKGLQNTLYCVADYGIITDPNQEMIACNSFRSKHDKFTYRTKLHADDAWFSYEKHVWKFSNDGRRYILKLIKSTPKIETNFSH